MPNIYLDHNSTSINDANLLNKLVDDKSLFFNPSSIHRDGQQSKMAIEKTRSLILKLLNIENDYHAIFFSSCTEVNNFIFYNFKDYTKMVSAIEHPSILNTIGVGEDIILIPVDKNGIIDFVFLENNLIELYNKNKKTIVSVMMANNETGVINDLMVIGRLCKKYNAILHSDIAQYFGKLPLDLNDLNIDLISISGHKIGSLLGVGVLLFKKGLKLQAMINGGRQEKNLRSGTENVLAIRSLYIILLRYEEFIEKYQKIKILRNKLEDGLLSIDRDITIFSRQVIRLPNTSCIHFSIFDSQILFMYLDDKGISIGKGSACSSGLLTKSHVIEAMGYSKNIAKNTLRISLGVNNTEEEINYLIQMINNLRNIY
ncbi:MAG: cysteine desulfurase [Anaplasmataceae bacterium]|nr:cysteine desulfurase [Anaplasmataceae bacterium]